LIVRTGRRFIFIIPYLFNRDIVEALKDKDNYVRITNKSKWLVYNEDTERFEVYVRPVYARKTKTLISTNNLAVALDRLIEGE